MTRSASQARDDIIGVVVDVLGTEGYDAVRLRDVARRARVSLSRIYGLFGNRDELIVAAVERWMDEHAYVGVVPPPGLGVYDGLLHVFRTVFEPWERNPQMLEAFHRARIGPGGRTLVEQGTRAIHPAIRTVLEGAEASYVRDVEQLLVNVFYAVFGRFADGELPITEVLPSLERVAFRLTADNAAAVAR